MNTSADSGSGDSGTSRRKLLVQAGVAGAAAWVAPTVVTALLSPAAASGAPGPLGFDYRFQNVFTSSTGGPAVAPDSSNGPTTLAFVSAAVDTNPARTVLSFTADSGVDFPVSALASPAAYTVAILFSLQDVAGYNKLIDYMNLGSDSGLYVLGGFANFYVGGDQIQGTKPILDNTFHQVVVTRDAAGTVTLYTDGVPQGTFNDGTGAGIAPTTLRFFQDDTATGTGEASPGLAARIRIFDGALTAGQVAALEVGRNAT